MSAQQDADNLAWDRSDELWEAAMKQVRLSSTCSQVESFAARVFGKPSTFITPLVIGGYNVLYPIQTEGSSETVLVRQPCPNQALFPDEKTLAEAATMVFISKNTVLPVPKLFYHGIDSELGPFMIIQDLMSRRNMSRALQKPRESTEETPVLNPDMPEDILKSLWVKMARCALQIAQPALPRIGVLVETAPGSCQVQGRPITMNMSNMVQHSNIPTSVFPPPGATYQTADNWYVALAEMQMATLLFQHNDMISSEDDCRNKYVARQIFRRLAKQGRLSNFGFAQDDWSSYSKEAQARISTSLPMPDISGPFCVWCDDFRPANVLVDEDHDDDVLGVIDWEFTYAAPAQFSLNPPWWLLLESPEAWDAGIDNWEDSYKNKLRIWFSALEEAEQEMRPDSFLLSEYMRQSWETGRFWLDYAARKSWAFDGIFWKYLDERFFGERQKDIPYEELWRLRVHLLTEEERVAMEMMVNIKMEESRERILVDWGDEEAKERLSQFFFE